MPAQLAVEGEISNVSQSGNGHLYFTLKDHASCIDCVIWRSDAARMKFKLADGLAVVAFGQVDVYEPRGRYQLYVTRVLPQGRGELELAFRQLHEKLEKLGWFDLGRKRPIPRIPRTIGLVTSRTGAAVRDILRTLAIRWPAARVVLGDARVQGEGSAESIAGAIARLNRHAPALSVDVLIVARGGGSIEDLWSFNTEIVARAIRDSRVPVISGVGHEIDITIADLVADLRAATPTAAAQAVVPDRREMVSQLNSAARLINSAVRGQLEELAGRLATCARSEIFRRPVSMLRSHRQRLDELSSRLGGGARERLHRQVRTLAQLAHRLQCQHPRAGLLAMWRRVDGLVGRLRWGLGRANVKAERHLADLVFRLRTAEPVSGRARRIETLHRQLAAYDPRAVLRRGYSITTIRETGELLTAAELAIPGIRLLTELSSGQVESEVVGRTGSAREASKPSRPRARRSQPGDQAQADLFGDGADDAAAEQ